MQSIPSFLFIEKNYNIGVNSNIYSKASTQLIWMKSLNFSSFDQNGYTLFLKKYLRLLNEIVLLDKIYYIENKYLKYQTINLIIMI